MSAETDAFAAAIQAVAGALLAAMADPADGVRLLASLADFTAAPVAASQPIGAQMALINGATSDLARRAAVTALARASSSYQPASFDDAATLRQLVCGLIDAEALIAADQGEDQSFAALKALKAAVAQDLTARGASLPPVVTITVGTPLPAPVLANRLYQDSTRADELIAEADPIHPAFMPVSFQALAR